jgi:hypothetical protein
VKDITAKKVKNIPVMGQEGDSVIKNTVPAISNNQVIKNKNRLLLLTIVIVTSPAAVIGIV